MVKRGRYYDYYYPHYEPTKARKVEGGMKIKSTRGQVGEKWWSKKLLALLSSFGWSSRMDRGRRYARSGQVLGITVQKGIVEAKVQGSQRSPYRIKITFPTLTENAWQSIFLSMERRPKFISDMLTGEMPAEIEDIFKETNHSLFPEKSKEIEMECSCPDYASPCKHIAAVFYVLADNLDEDPFLLLQLKGKNKDEIMKSISIASHPEDDKETSTQPDSKALSNEVIYKFWGSSPVNIKVNRGSGKHTVFPLDKYPLPFDFNDSIVSSTLTKYYERIRNGMKGLKLKTFEVEEDN